jgi:hypothetical protein
MRAAGRSAEDDVDQTDRQIGPEFRGKFRSGKKRHFRMICSIDTAHYPVDHGLLLTLTKSRYHRLSCYPEARGRTMILIIRLTGLPERGAKGPLRACARPGQRAQG